MDHQRSVKPQSDIILDDQNDADIGDRLRFEQMISNLSARFINVPDARLDDEIEAALAEVLAFFQVGRCALIQTLHGKDAWRITHVAASPDAPPVPKGSVLPRSINPWAYEQLTEKAKAVSFSNFNQVPATAHVDKQTWASWGIRSNLCIPILLGESVDHLIAINALTQERTWPTAYIPRLQMLGEIFVNALERRKTEKTLRENEAQLNLAAASADAGLWSIYTDTGRLWTTAKLRDIFHFPPNEALTFERFLESVHPDDRQMARETLDVCLQSHELVRLEYRIVGPDGTVVCRHSGTAHAGDGGHHRHHRAQGNGSSAEASDDGNPALERSAGAGKPLPAG